MARGLQKIATYPLHRKRNVIVGITALSIAALFLFPHIEFESDMSKMNFLTPELANAEATLKEATQGGDMKFALSTGNTLEDALDAQAGAEAQLNILVDSGRVERFSSLSGLLPSTNVQRARIEAWNAFWTDSLVAQVKENCIQSSVALGFDPDAFYSFYGLLENKPQTTDIQELKDDFGLLISPFINEKDGQFYVSSLIKTSDQTDLSVEWKDDRTSSFDRSSMTSTVLEILKTDFNQVVGYSMVLVFLILLGSFRRIELALLTFIPIVLSWLWSLAIMVVLGLKFTIFNVIVSTFIFGLGVDYCIFMTRGLIQGHATKSKSILTFRTSIILSMITTLVGIGVLIFAEHPSLRSIASLSIIGILSVVIVSFTIQPFLFRLFVSKRTAKGFIPVTLWSMVGSTIAYFIFLFGCGLLAITAPILRAIPGKKERKQLRYHKMVSFFGGFIIDIAPTVRYIRQNLPMEKYDKPCLVICNHHSFVDILVLINQTPKLVLLTNNWVYNSPFFGRIVRKAGYYNVNEGFEGAIPALKQRVKQGYSIGVFPEGTRNTKPKLARFKKGAFVLAEELELDIVPIILHGTHHIMNKGNDFLFKDGTLTIKTLPRIKHDDASFGTGYRERAKAISNHFKAEYQKTRDELETPTYFKGYLRKAYTFRGEEVLKTVNRRLRDHLDRFEELNRELPREGKILIVNCGYGSVCYLLAKCSENREIFGFDDDNQKLEIMRNVGAMPENVIVTDSDDTDGFDVVVDGMSLEVLRIK